jgi:hypothetical protein
MYYIKYFKPHIKRPAYAFESQADMGLSGLRVYSRISPDFVATDARKNAVGSVRGEDGAVAEEAVGEVSGGHIAIVRPVGIHCS